MFPYPSGAGLHVGHPLGFIGTDVLGRYLRMTGHNVLHAMGFDAFGLPAEQYAVQTGTHPRTTTEANIARYKAQLRRLGLAHDERRSVATTDVEFYRWTQWIFLQIYDSCYDEQQRRARPIEELEAEFAAGARPTPDGRPWAELSDGRAAARVIDSFRLAYVSEAPVNWCPGLGTVLANEEVTADGRSERGQLPRVPPQPEAVDDADHRVRRPAGRRPGPAGLAGFGQGDAAQLDRPVRGRAGAVRRRRCPIGPAIEVFTTRPDTLFGATYMVLAPEHPLVDADRRPAPGRWTPTRAGPAARRDPGRRPSRPTARPRRASPTWTARRTRTRPASSPAPSPSTRSTGRRSRCSSPTTC